MFVQICVCILLFACCESSVERSGKLQCKDEDNKPVDWYVLYKLPKSPNSSNPLIRKGLGYVYMTSETVAKGWQLSAESIGSPLSMPGVTLAPIYDDDSPDSKLWGLYNDSPASRVPYVWRYGHTKGVVVANKEQGFWMVHSVPSYPPMPNGGESKTRKNRTSQSSPRDGGDSGKYGYPPTGQLYGQNFFCVSLGSDQFETVGKQLAFNQIIVYRRNVPETLGQQYPVLKDAVNQVRLREEPYSSKSELKTLNGVELVSFAKSDRWQKDLYDQFIAPELGIDLYVQTWLNGRGRLPNDCGRRKVYNIKSLVINEADVNFESSRDHSKWAVAVRRNAKKTWICIADINRAETQYSRGGGALCMDNADAWKNYRDAVVEVEPCPAGSASTTNTV